MATTGPGPPAEEAPTSAAIDVDPLVVLSITGPLPYSILAQLVDDSSIAQAEKHSTVDVPLSPSGLVHALADAPTPLAADRIRTTTAIAEALASLDSLTTTPSVNLRLADILVEVGIYADEIIRSGARAALLSGEAARAADICRFGLGHDRENIDLLHMLAMALEARGQHGAATGVDTANSAMTDPAWLGRWASNLFLSTGRTVSIAPTDVAGDRGEVQANLAWIQALEGDIPTVAETANAVLDDPRSSSQAVVWACVAGAVPAALDGREKIARRLVNHSQDLLIELRDELSPFAKLQVGLVDSLTTTRLGHLRQGASKAERGSAESESPFLSAVWSFFGGIACREMGEFETASALFTRGLRGVEADPFGLVPWARSEAAVCEHLLERSDAPAVVDSSEAHGLFRSCLMRNNAWIAAARDDIEEARKTATMAIDTALDLGQNAHAALAMMDLARFGTADAAARQLTRLTTTDSPLIAGAAEFVLALDSSDPLGLLGAARTLRALGFNLHSDELVHLLRSRSARARTGLIHTARLDLLGRPIARPTPLFRNIATIERQLTDREAEVALACTGGTSSRDVAGQLSISTRTVDNLLGRVYRKCDFGGKADLQTWLREHV